jgi:hypothetical protein
MDLTDDGKSNMNDMLGFIDTTELKNATSYIASDVSSFRWRGDSSIVVHCNLINSGIGLGNDVLAIYHWQSQINESELFPPSQEKSIAYSIAQDIQTYGYIDGIEIRITTPGGVLLPINENRAADNTVLRLALICD